MLGPYDPEFNAAVERMCAIYCPRGFDTTADEAAAPATLDAVSAYIRAHGKPLVWTGASDLTIFGYPEANWAFRAWHDVAHYLTDAPFTLAGERATFVQQRRMLHAAYRLHPSFDDWAMLLLAEVVGQAEYLDRYGEFPADQRAFTLSFISSR